MLSQRRLGGWLFVIILVGTLLCIPQSLYAQGVEPLLPTTLEGCYDVAVYGVGMFDTGSGTISVNPVDGTVVAAHLEWVGAEDTTPGGATLDGTSTLTVNGVAVDGVLAGPLTPTGSAGYDPHGFTSAGPAGWLSWHADLGPGGYAVVPAVLDHGLTLAVSGWDSPAKQTNGASLTLILEKPTCAQETQVDFKTGVNWYRAGLTSRLRATNSVCASPTLVLSAVGRGSLKPANRQPINKRLLGTATHMLTHF